MSGPVCQCGQPTAGAWLCDQCQKTLAYALANVAAYYEDLDVVAGKQARYSSSAAIKGSIGRTMPLPVDMRFVNASDGPGRATLARGAQLRWDTWNTVVAWCRTVMEEQPEVAGPVCGEPCLHTSCHVIRQRRWPRNDIWSMCLYLDRQHRWIHGRDWVVVMLDEFLDLEHRLCRMVNRPPDKWYAGRCSQTDESGNTCTTELYALTEKGDIECHGCGFRHDVAGRRDFLLAEAKDYLVTATEAAGALMAWTDYDGSENKLVDRIRKWRDRGRIAVRGQVELGGRDRDLYRLGDLQELLVADAQREQERRLSL